MTGTTGEEYRRRRKRPKKSRLDAVVVIRKQLLYARMWQGSRFKTKMADSGRRKRKTKNIPKNRLNTRENISTLSDITVYKLRRSVVDSTTVLRPYETIKASCGHYHNLISFSPSSHDRHYEQLFFFLRIMCPPCPNTTYFTLWTTKPYEYYQ